MSEEQDRASKTEEPTEKKIQDALEKRECPGLEGGPDLSSSIVSILAVTFLYISNGVTDLAGTLERFIDDPAGIALHDGSDATSLMHVIAMASGWFLLAARGDPRRGRAFGFLPAKPAAPRGGARQAQAQPDLPENPASGGIFGAQGWMEFGKAVFKFAIIRLRHRRFALLRCGHGW